jgi:hypothetical protein
LNDFRPIGVLIGQRSFLWVIAKFIKLLSDGVHLVFSFLGKEHLMEKALKAILVLLHVVKIILILEEGNTVVPLSA